LFQIRVAEKYITEKLKVQPRCVGPKGIPQALRSAMSRLAKATRKIVQLRPAWRLADEGRRFDRGSTAWRPYNNAGGYKSGRPDKLLKFSSRTLRPVTDFSVCTKCTLCWLQCQDGSFDVTPDGYYDANMEYCMGCGVCEAVCRCRTASPWSANSLSPTTPTSGRHTPRQGRLQGVAEDEDSERAASVPPVTGYRGQYKEEIPAALEIANKA